MKKIFKKKYFGIIFILLIAFFAFGNTIFAELTEEVNTSSISGVISKIIKGIADVALNLSTAGLAAIVTALSLVLFVVLQTVFTASGTTENILNVPFPDAVVFNRVPLLEANFVNPSQTNSSPIYVVKTTITSIYDTFIIIAIALFTIIAMVIGIKLALASIASERAKYKQAIGYWVTGIVLLVCLKWVLAGMFKINEEIVRAAYYASKGSEMQFEVFSLASIPLIGSTISTIMSWFGGNASATSFGKVPGYLGLVLKYFLEGLGGNFVSSAVTIVVLGQTITIIASYLKRVFYCLLLGVIGPLIIAVDTFNRSVGKGSKILSNWFKQLALTIFTQSFHAIFMTVILLLMVKISESNLGQYLRSIIIIILTTGLIKFEKTIKQLFGISDGFMGDLKGGAMKAMATMGAMSKAARSVSDNGKKLKEQKSRKSELVAEKARLETRQAVYEKMGNGMSGFGPTAMVANSATSSTSNLAPSPASVSAPVPAPTVSSFKSPNDIQKRELLAEATIASCKADKFKNQARSKLEMAKSVGNDSSLSESEKRDRRIDLENEARDLRLKAVEQQEIAKRKTNLANNIKTDTNTASNTTSSAAPKTASNDPTEANQVQAVQGNAQSNSGGDDEVKSILRNINSQLMENKRVELEEKLRKVDKEIGKAEEGISSAKLAKLMAPANVVVGAAAGIGLDNMAAGAMLTTGLDHIAERTGRIGADAKRSRLYDESVEKGRENKEILREKVLTKDNIKQVIVNTVTQKPIRDTVMIISGNDSDSNSAKKMDISNYKYVKAKNDNGHKTISSNIDNV